MSPNSIRNQKVTVRMTEAEKETLKQIAGKNNISLSETVRTLTFTFIDLSKEKELKVYERDQDIQVIKNLLKKVSARVKSLESRLIYEKYKQMIQEVEH